MTVPHDPSAPPERAVASPGAAPPTMDPVAVIRSKPYLTALVLAAVLGMPISAVSYGFLALVTKIQDCLFTDLPDDVFSGGVPAWWPVPWLVLCGVLTGLTIRYLPGNGGHSPAFGFMPAVVRPSTGSCRGSSSRRWPRSAWAPSWGPRRR